MSSIYPKVMTTKYRMRKEPTTATLLPLEDNVTLPQSPNRRIHKKDPLQQKINHNTTPHIKPHI